MLHVMDLFANHYGAAATAASYSDGHYKNLAGKIYVNPQGGAVQLLTQLRGIENEPTASEARWPLFSQGTEIQLNDQTANPGQLEWLANNA